LTGSPRVVVTLLVFGVMLGLVVWRPRRYHEACWTVLGAVTMLLFRLVSPQQALAVVLAGKSALLFLLALLLLSLLVEKSGFFDWAAIVCARVAAGDGRALYRNAFLLGALVTVVLSLDTTAVMLTPVLLSLVKRLRLPAAPYLALCAFVANIASLLLPISNLTNILFASAFKLTFALFALRMLAPQLVALLVTYAFLRRYLGRELPNRFDFRALPEPSSVVPDARYFRASVIVLGAVLLGYFLAPLLGVEPYTVAFIGSAALLAFGSSTGRVRSSSLRELSWGVFPFVVGLFIAVRGLENLGVTEALSRWLTHSESSLTSRWLAIAGVTSLAANTVNNLPAALLSRSALLAAHAGSGAAFAALIGADAGSIVTPFGSLATLLVFAIARREGAAVAEGRIFWLALALAPVVVLASTLTLVLTFVVLP
jgi:arsenical pump membrane protein